MAYTISGSVGIGGANRKNDVATVQFLLNCAPPGQGGANPELVKDGICGLKTVGAIQAFQKRWFGKADSLVEPGKQTMSQLNANVPSINRTSRSCQNSHYPRHHGAARIAFAFQPINFGIIHPGLERPGSDDPQNRQTVYLPVMELKPMAPLQPLSAREQADGPSA